VSSFPFVGSVINGDKSISEGITHRIKKGNTRVVPEVPDLTKKKKHFGKKSLYFST
jgi:hypothetical protein